VFRIRIVNGERMTHDDYADEATYHARWVEVRRHLREQTYIPVNPASDDYSALADLSQEHKV